MESKHTPGPWAIQKRSDARFRIVSKCSWEWDIATVDDDVNCCLNSNLDGNGISKESIANANIIVAAPDMFEVIKELYEYSMNIGHKGLLFPKIEAAYLKATGQQIIPIENQ